MIYQNAIIYYVLVEVSLLILFLVCDFACQNITLGFGVISSLMQSTVVQF